jgi:hypothetical protein
MPLIEVGSADGVGPWLLEADISNGKSHTRPLRSLLTNTALFPFAVKVSPRELTTRPRLEVHRQGLDEDVVSVRSSRA